MLLFETRLFIASYFEYHQSVQILVKDPEVNNRNGRLIATLTAKDKEDAVFVAKKYVLDLILETGNSLVAQG